MGLGIIMGAMEGAGDAGQQIAQSNTRLWDAQALAAQNAALEMTKSQSLIDYQNTVADQQRDQAVSRINTAKQPIIANQMAEQYAPSDAAVADAAAGNTGAPLSPDQLAAIAQSKQQTATSLQNDPSITAQAAFQTGDLGVKDAASIAGAQSAAKYAADSQARMQQFQSALENQKEIAQAALAGTNNQAAEDRLDARLAADRASSAGGGAAQGSQLMQQIAFMKSNPTLFDNTDIKSGILERPQVNLADLTAKLLDADPKLSAAQAGQKAKDIANYVNTPTISALPLPATQAEMVAGKVYATAKGHAIWNGAAFAPLQGQ